MFPLIHLQRHMTTVCRPGHHATSLASTSSKVRLVCTVCHTWQVTFATASGSTAMSEGALQAACSRRCAPDVAASCEVVLRIRRLWTSLPKLADCTTDGAAGHWRGERDLGHNLWARPPSSVKFQGAASRVLSRHGIPQQAQHGLSCSVLQSPPAVSSCRLHHITEKGSYICSCALTPFTPTSFGYSSVLPRT